MKQFITILLLSFISYWSAANIYFPADTVKPGAGSVPVKDSAAVNNQDSSVIFAKVEIEASYPGGDDAWRKYLENNVNGGVAAEYGAPAGVYTVIVQFVVDRNGSISNLTALTRHGFGMEGEVIRVLRRGPKWIPAMQDGRTVKAYRKQPVTFVVTEEKKKRKNKN